MYPASPDVKKPGRHTSHAIGRVNEVLGSRLGEPLWRVNRLGVSCEGLMNPQSML